MFDEFTDLFGPDSFGDDIEVESKPTPVKSDAIARLLRDRTVPTCAFCGSRMPEDRINDATKKGRKFKYCSAECTTDAKNALRTDRIITANRTLTSKVAACHFASRDEIIADLLADYIRFRIGCFYDDRAMQNKMRLQAEAISNAFLFGSRANKSVYHYFITYANKHHPDIAGAIYNPSTLMTFAKEIGLVSHSYSAPTPVMIDFRQGDAFVEDSATEETKSSNERYAKIATNIKDQIIYSGLLKYASTHKKRSDWAAWVFKSHFGYEPDGLMNVEASITDEVMNIIRDTSKRYVDVLKPRAPVTHAPVEAQKAPMEALIEPAAPSAPEVVPMPVEAPQEAHGKIIASSFNDRVEVFADYILHRMTDRSIEFSEWARSCGYEDTSIRDALDFMRNASESDERRMVVYFKRCGIPESEMF